MIRFEQFEAVDIHTGTVTSAELFPEGKYSTHILQIDFGETIGTKKSLARLIPYYKPEDLLGIQVLCVTNFEPRQIGPHKSEVLTLGVMDADDNVVLIQSERGVPNGKKLC